MFNEKNSQNLDRLINGPNMRLKELIIKRQNENFGNLDDFEPDDGQIIADSVSNLLNILQMINITLREFLDFDSFRKNMPKLKKESLTLSEVIFQIRDEVQQFTATQIASILYFMTEIYGSYSEVLVNKPNEVINITGSLTGRKEMAEKEANIMKSLKKLYSTYLLPPLVSLEAAINSSTGNDIYKKNDRALEEPEPEEPEPPTLREARERYFSPMFPNNENANVNSGYKTPPRSVSSSPIDDNIGEFYTPSSSVKGWNYFLSPSQQIKSKNKKMSREGLKKYYGQFNREKLDAYMNKNSTTVEGLPNRSDKAWKAFESDPENLK
jgi:hypothetical protein